MNKDTCVRQHPGHHPLDPRIRVISLFWIAILILAAKTWVTLGIVAAVVVLGLITAKVHLMDMVLLLRKVLVFIVIILLLQGISQSGRILFSVAGYYFTLEGLTNGVFLSLQIILLLFLSKSFVATTSIGEIFDALEWPLNHLRRGSSYLLTLGLTINFVPLLTRSARQIKSAQIARGGDDSTSFVSHVKFAVSAALPLFVMSLRTSHHLADAIDARGYNRATPRTPFAILKTRTVDWLWMGVLGAISGIGWISR